jgi:hypothetical protein
MPIKWIHVWPFGKRAPRQQEVIVGMEAKSGIRNKFGRREEKGQLNKESAFAFFRVKKGR